MKNAPTLALAAASILLVGQGCAPLAPSVDLPTSPPAAEMMEKTDESSMEPAEDAMAPEEDGAMMKKDEDSAAEAGAGAMMEATLAPYYIAYTEAQAAAALKEARATVLYFWAAWCPICKAEEPKLKAWIEGSDLPIAGFRVNYDTEAALKAKYKIPYQHTTVFLNAKGEEVERFSGPVDEATFMAALKKASGK